MLLHDFCFEYHQNEFVLEDGIIVSSAEEHVVLGITIDSRLTIYSNLEQLCKKVTNKLNTLAESASYIRHTQRRLNYSSSLIGQLSYCLLIVLETIKSSYKPTLRPSS